MKSSLLLLFFTFSFLFRTDHSFDQDLGRHIKLGEIIWNSKVIPHTNLFSYTNPDFPFINTHWLFEVITYGFSQANALQLFLMLKIAIILVSIWLVLKTIPKENMALLLPIGFLFLHVLRERTDLRPEIFSFLFTATTYYILDKFSSHNQMSSDRGTFGTSNKLIFLLPIIQIIWINTHIYFFVGLMLQTIYLIHKRTKLLAIILGLSMAISLINPNGLNGLTYPLNVTKNYGYTIVENQTMFFLEGINFRDPNFFFVKLSLGIISLSLIVSLIRRQLNPKNILLSLSGLVLALVNVRSFPYLIFLSLPAALQNFGTIKSNSFTKTLAFFTALFLIFESFNYLNGEYYRQRDDYHANSLKFVESSKEALNFVLNNNLPQPIFNNFDIGSYIIYKGFPKYKIFVDGRPEAYPKEFFQNTYIPAQYDYAKFKQLGKALNFQTIIFSHTDQTPWGAAFLQNIVKDKDWNLVFIDDFMLVFVKGSTLEERNLSPVDLTKLNPNTYRFDNHVSYLRLGLFLLRTQNNQTGIEFIKKAVQIYPKSPVANQILKSL